MVVDMQQAIKTLFYKLARPVDDKLSYEDCTDVLWTQDDFGVNPRIVSLALPPHVIFGPGAIISSEQVFVMSADNKLELIREDTFISWAQFYQGVFEKI